MSIRLRSGCGVVILIDEYDKTLIQYWIMRNFSLNIKRLCRGCSRNYALPFMSDGRKVYKIGVNFSAETRNIDRWIVAE